jgi:hypothetical protein
MTDPIQTWRDALASELPVRSLRQLAQDRLATGAQKEQLEQELGDLVLELREEGRDADEDVVLDVLDMLTGWSHPSMKL